VLKIIDFGVFKFLRTIVYEEDNIDSLNSNSIEQNEDADMNFDDLITLNETLHKKNKMYRNTNKNLEKMHKNLKNKNKNNELLEKHDRLTQVNESLYDITSCFSSLNDLKNENDAFRKQFEDTTSTLAKFTQGRDNLDVLLGGQNKSLHKSV
jgi:uncharacterized protein YoxC